MTKQIVKQDPSREYRIARKNAELMGGTWDATTRTWTVVKSEPVAARTLKSYGLLEVSRQEV